jgi:hypothetical protein
MRDLLRRVGAAAAAAVCFSASVVALCWSWADLTVRSTRAPERPSDIAGMTQDRWHTAVRRLQQSRALNPLEANYAAELGRHYAWLAWRIQGMPGKSAGYRSISRASYLDAIRIRPTWGFSWVNYAEADLLARGNNTSTHLALRRAIALAPYEPKVQLKVLTLGFSLWDGLSEDIREGIRDTLKRAVAIGNDVDLIIRLAVQTKRVSDVADILTEKRHLEALEKLAHPANR